MRSRSVDAGGGGVRSHSCRTPRDVDKGLRVPRTSRSTARGIHRQDRDADRWMFSLVDIRLATPQNDGQAPTFSESELLLWACALESRASHPVATAVLAGAGAATRLAAKTCVVNHFETLPGEGASALVDGKKVEIGGTALFNCRNWRRERRLARIHRGRMGACWCHSDLARRG